MVKKMRDPGPARLDWRPKNLGETLHDVALAIEPGLTRGDFGTALKQYLQRREFSQSLDRGLIDKLYRHTCHCRQMIEAVRRMHEVVQSGDWARREATFGFLRKQINSYERRLGKYRDPRLPLTDMLVRSITNRIRTFNKSVDHDLRFYARMTANEKALISGYLKPEVESHYILDIYNFIAKHLRPIKEKEILLIVAGCIHAGMILPRARDEHDFHNLINSRIRRARNAFKQESAKFEWGREDGFGEFQATPESISRTSRREEPKLSSSGKTGRATNTPR